MSSGKEHSRYDDACVRVNVGSAADAQVCLPWAAKEHLKIYPMHAGYYGARRRIDDHQGPRDPGDLMVREVRQNALRLHVRRFVSVDRA